MEKARRTQTSDIKKYLKRYKKGLTQDEAKKMFGTDRLASIIFNLRKRHGMNIVTKNEYTKNRYGTISRYARYKLV